MLSACFLLFVFVFVVFALLGTGSDRATHAAYALLRTGNQLFEPEASDVPPRTVAAPSHKTVQVNRRPYLSPFTKKKVAAQQRWKCANCGRLLDETYEIDHITPLFKARNETERRQLNSIANLNAKCRRCHMSKSAMERLED